MRGTIELLGDAAAESYFEFHISQVDDTGVLKDPTKILDTFGVIKFLGIIKFCIYKSGNQIAFH